MRFLCAQRARFALLQGGRVFLWRQYATHHQWRSLYGQRKLAALLREREHDATAVVVEHNGRIVPAADFAATALNEGDVLEIVQFVGGG